MKLKRITSLVLVLSALFAVLQSWQQKKPHVFLVGDSISIHYGPYLKKYTAEFAQLQQKELETIQGKEFPRNGGDSRRVLNYLTYKLNEPGFKPDYLLLNCGLHDIGRDTITRELQVPLAEYEVNLEKIFKLVSDKKIKLLWMNTTPVVDSIHNKLTKAKLRFASDLSAYNHKAAEVCRKYKVPVIDLYDFTKKLGNVAYADNVHFKDFAREMQGSFLTEELRKQLE